MTLDEGIRHAEDVAERNEEIAEKLAAREVYAKKCKKCAEEHLQLAEWLKELKAYKEQSGDVSRSEIPNTYGDAISREAAVNAIYDLCGENVSLKENPWRDNPHMDAVVDALENLPSVTPQPIECEERKSGNCPFYAN